MPFWVLTTGTTSVEAVMNNQVFVKCPKCKATAFLGRERLGKRMKCWNCYCPFRVKDANAERKGLCARLGQSLIKVWDVFLRWQDGIKDQMAERANRQNPTPIELKVHIKREMAAGKPAIQADALDKTITCRSCGRTDAGIAFFKVIDFRGTVICPGCGRNYGAVH